MNKKILLLNMDRIHSTELGINRIKKNLNLDNCDVIGYCKNKIKNSSANIYKSGKNWYCDVDNIRITINSYSYTIITVHIIK